MIVNAERAQGYTQPGYAELVIYQDRQALILGNSVQTRKDGTQWIWAADWRTGERIEASLPLVAAASPEQPALIDVVRKVETWANGGNDDAMWWLGDFYEFGSKVTGANGGKALAYYLGAIRCEPKWYDKDTVSRVLHDGATLFKSAHAVGIKDHTPSDVCEFLAKFREYRAMETEGVVHYPDSKNWAECIAIAEALN